MLTALPEHWAAVDGYPYEVSNLGRVRRAGNAKQSMMALHSSSRGYFYVKLTNAGRRTKFSIHGLVAAAFIGPRPVGHEVNHRDGDKANNVPINLEYVTHAENLRHAKVTGLNPCVRGWRNSSCAGERHYGAKLTEQAVREIRGMSKEGISRRALARQFGVGSSAIHAAVRKHTWAHVD